MLQWVDHHLHLNMLELPSDQVVQQAVALGVVKMISIGTCPEDLPLVLGFVEQHSPYVFGSLGIHPHDANLYSDTVDVYIRENLQHPRIVSVGEMGLDYYYDKCDRGLQREVFRRQLQVAEELQLPVQVHTRDAEQDTIDILESFGGRVSGVIHCFTGSTDLATAVLGLGLHLSVSGVVTFKKAEELRETLSLVPLERILLETDAPFLAPTPHRGKKNLPEYVVNTAAFMANLRGVSLEKLSEITGANSQRVFPKMYH